jgi:hypothetical protein
VIELKRVPNSDRKFSVSVLGEISVSVSVLGEIFSFGMSFGFGLVQAFGMLYLSTSVSASARKNRNFGSFGFV